MPTSAYFNNFGSSQEQNLIEDLIVESIKIYGHDVLYLPRRELANDKIYGEDVGSYYNAYYLVEMYIKNIDSFDGEGTLFTKFNLDIKDQITFTISKRSFSDEIGVNEATLRPNEGDLIYLPLNQKIFQIRYVENKAIFYQLGALQTFDLTCELFEYSGEVLDTGVPEIDAMQANYSPALSNESILTEEFNYYYLLDEDGYKLVMEEFDLETQGFQSDNQEFQIEGNTFIDFTEIDPFSEGRI